MLILNRSHQLLLALAVGICLLTALQTDAAPRAKHVFIISYDQGNPDLIQKTDMPVFHEMAKQGARTWEAYTIVPSLTLPSHASMLTGVGIQKHQITWNGYEPNRGLVKVPTVFSLAHQKGLVTAMFVGKEKFEHLVLSNSVDTYIWPKDGDDAKSVAKLFAEEVGKLKPNLSFIHFRDPDTEGHAHGAASPEKIKALKDCDEALKIIREAVDAAGLTKNSVFILTADHGGHDFKDKEGKTRGTHGSPDTEDVLIPWVAWGKGVKKDYTITSPVLQYDTAATALWLLNVPLPEHFWGRPVKSAFK